jgi:two-component system LytT family response regulator
MAAVEARLDPNLFVRIHRSAIVNIARIREAVPWFNGEHALVLQDGTELNIGRSYRERFEQMMAA